VNIQYIQGPGILNGMQKPWTIFLVGGKDSRIARAFGLFMPILGMAPVALSIALSAVVRL
jgi:hypothetical protein